MDRAGSSPPDVDTAIRHVIAGYCRNQPSQPQAVGPRTSPLALYRLSLLLVHYDDNARSARSIPDALPGWLCPPVRNGPPSVATPWLQIGSHYPSPSLASTPPWLPTPDGPH